MYLLQALNSKNSFIPQSHTLSSVPANVVLGFGKSETTHCPAMPRCPRAVLKASSKWSPENGWNNSIEENMVIICTVILWGTSLTCAHRNDLRAPNFMWTHIQAHKQPLGDMGGTWGWGENGGPIIACISACKPNLNQPATGLGASPIQLRLARNTANTKPRKMWSKALHQWPRDWQTKSLPLLIDSSSLWSLERYHWCTHPLINWATLVFFCQVAGCPRWLALFVPLHSKWPKAEFSALPLHIESTKCGSIALFANLLC